MFILKYPVKILTVFLLSLLLASPAFAYQFIPPKQPEPSPKLNLVWDHITQKSPNLSNQEKIEGLDILSPTWFAVIDETGRLSSLADSNYVEAAHAKGYKVWPLITNSFNPDLTGKVLADEKAQDAVITALSEYARQYNLDGINIDFENIYDSDKEKFVVFVDKLTKKLKQQNLVVSIDVTVPSNTPNWSRCYDRAKLGQIVDYVMVMTYDEHWRKSPVSGPVASLPWVEKGIQATLELVPKEKILLGLPFYTREWEETTDDYGQKTVSAKTLSMSAAQKIIDTYNLSPVWLNDQGVNYVEYNKNGNLYRIWLEDSKSISLKAALVQKYGLAGAASWRKGFEAQHIWFVIDNALRPE